MYPEIPYTAQLIVTEESSEGLYSTPIHCFVRFRWWQTCDLRFCNSN